MTGVRVARGCAAGAVFTFAGLVVLFGFPGTVETESFPGLQRNNAPLVVCTPVFAALLAVGGLALAGRRSYAGRGPSPSWASSSRCGCGRSHRSCTAGPTTAWAGTTTARTPA
jgi:hypothetical protein